MIDTKGLQILKVVHAEDVEQHTRIGWVLIDVLQDSDVLLNSRTVYAPASANPNYYPQSHIENECVPRPRALFLLGLDAGSELATKEEINSRLAADVLKACNEAKAAVSALEQLRNERALLDVELENQRKRADANLVSLTETRERVRKMEVDLGKIRNAIGERQMREIWAEVKP